jgi:hypothetical protein
MQHYRTNNNNKSDVTCIEALNFRCKLFVLEHSVRGYYNGEGRGGNGSVGFSGNVVGAENGIAIQAVLPAKTPPSNALLVLFLPQCAHT